MKAAPRERFFLIRERKNTGKIAQQIDGQCCPHTVGGQNDLVDQAAHQFRRFDPLIPAIQTLNQILDLILVVLRHARMQQGRGFIGALDHDRQFSPPGFQNVHAVFDTAGRDARHDGVDQLIKLARRALQLPLIAA